MAETEQAATNKIFDLIIFRWQNSIACEKDRSLCGGARISKNPYTLGFGLDVRLY
jgi:hypothetical protein